MSTPEEDFYENYNKVMNELAKIGSRKVKVIADTGSMFDIEQITQSAIADNIKENEDKMHKRNAFLEINNQPLYWIIHTKILEICFDVERVDSYNQIHKKEFLKENIYKSVKALKELEEKYPLEFDLALPKTIAMFLESVMCMKKPLNENNEFTVNNALIALKIFKSIQNFENEYYDKINNLK